jgi:hypothetical protein
VRSPGRGGGTGVLYMATGCRRPEELLLPALLYDLLLQQRDLCLLLLCLLLALPYLLDLCARTPSTSAEPSGRIRNPMCALAALLGRTCLKPPVCQLFLFRKPSPPPMANDDARLESEPDSGRTLSRRHNDRHRLLRLSHILLTHSASALLAQSEEECAAAWTTVRSRRRAPPR